MKVIFCYLTLIFLASSLYLTEQFNSIGNIAVAGLILLIFPIVVIMKKDKYKVNTLTLILMYCYFLLCTISALYNTDIQMIVGAFIIFALYLSSLVIIPSLRNIKINKFVYRGVIVSLIPCIFLPLIINGLNSNPYKGIFYNPNAFGSTAATLFATVFPLLVYKFEKYIGYAKVEKYIKTKLFLYLCTLFFITFLVVLSGSRTSILAVLGVAVCGVLIVTIRLIKERKIAPFIFKGFSFTIVSMIFASLLIKLTPFYEYLNSNILHKFELKANRGDILDSRGTVWEKAIGETGMFGNGSSYFSHGSSAHNTFINILGEYGWLPLMVFVLFLIYIFISSFKYALSDIDDKYKYLPLTITFSFILLSMGEVMMFKLGMIAMFFCAGSTLGRKELLKKQMHSKNTKKDNTVINRKKIVW